MKALMHIVTLLISIQGFTQITVDTVYFTRDWSRIEDKSKAEIVGLKHYDASGKGVAFYYLKPGYLYSIQHEINSEREGYCVWYHNNGQPKADAYYIKDKAAGFSNNYDKKGSLTLMNFYMQERMENEIDKTNLLIDYPDLPPLYPGGLNGARAYINSNLNPETLESASSYSGLVYVTFIVELSGEVSNVDVVYCDIPGLERQLVDILTMMPDWEPAKIKSKSYRCKYALPLFFDTGYKGAKKMYKGLFE